MPPAQFSSQEMADLLTYLFAERYFEARGNAERGLRLFNEKGCARCHTLGGGASVGPDLTRWQGGASPVLLANALWNHGPLMLERIQEQRISWPHFEPGEMADLVEFLGRQYPARLQARGKQ